MYIFLSIVILIILVIGIIFIVFKPSENKLSSDETLENQYFENESLIYSGFTVGKDAQANALQHLDNVTQSNSFYHNHEEEDWIQAHEYDEYEELFESEEETANRLSIEMLDDELINKDDCEDFLLDFEDENDNLCENEIDYFDEEEFLSKFYDVEIEEQPTKAIENPKST